MDIFCYHCHKVLEDIDEKSQIGKTQECPHCKTSLKCCKMCLFYDHMSYNECKEPMAERIVEKEKANFCDYFQIGYGDGDKNNKDELLAKADSLFKF